MWFLKPNVNIGDVRDNPKRSSEVRVVWKYDSEYIKSGFTKIGSESFEILSNKALKPLKLHHRLMTKRPGCTEKPKK